MKKGTVLSIYKLFNLLNASFSDIDKYLAVLQELEFTYSLVRQVVGLPSLTAVP